MIKCVPFLRKLVYNVLKFVAKNKNICTSPPPPPPPPPHKMS